MTGGPDPGNDSWPPAGAAARDQAPPPKHVARGRGGTGTFGSHVTCYPSSLRRLSRPALHEFRSKKSEEVRDADAEQGAQDTLAEAFLDVRV